MDLQTSFKHYRVNFYPPYQFEESRYLERQDIPVFRYHRGESDWTPFERGGLTICEIRDDAGNIIATGEAECSLKDAFCYRIGRQIAEGRARKRLNQ